MSNFRLLGCFLLLNFGGVVLVVVLFVVVLVVVVLVVDVSLCYCGDFSRYRPAGGLSRALAWWRDGVVA